MISPFDRIESIADNVATQYRSTIEMMRGQENLALAKSDALTPSGISNLRRSLEELCDMHLAAVNETVHYALMDMVGEAKEEAERQTGLSLETETDTSALEDFAEQEHEAQLMRDAAQVLRFHRQRAYEARLRATTHGVDYQQAIMDVRIKSMGDKRTLWFTDRAGRRIASHKHIRRFWRGLLRDAYMQTLAESLALSGALRARIVHPDPRYNHFGSVVHLDGTSPGLSDYENVFHPNSQASLLAETVFQEAHA